MVAEVTALVVVDASSRGTVPLFKAALEADAPIIELVPLDLRRPERAVPEPPALPATRDR
jgi:hypothetical protein